MKALSPAPNTTRAALPTSAERAFSPSSGLATRTQSDQPLHLVHSLGFELVGPGVLSVSDQLLQREAQFVRATLFRAPRPQIREFAFLARCWETPGVGLASSGIHSSPGLALISDPARPVRTLRGDAAPEIPGWACAILLGVCLYAATRIRRRDNRRSTIGDRK